MKKIIQISILFLLMHSSLAFGQENVREEVYLSVSSTDLIVGESLYFSAFVSSQFNRKPSRLSRILYVALLNERSETVSQTKVMLSEGRGEGTVFLSADMETGNYHLVAYTRWMRNFDDLYHQRVVVINPYKSLKKTEVDREPYHIDFFPEGGHLVSAIQNRIVLYATNSFEQGISVKGKIVSNKGEKIVEVETNDDGFFEFVLTPKADQSYRFILESAQGFEFYDLPTSKEGVGVQVKTTAGQIVVALFSGNAGEKENAEKKEEDVIDKKDKEEETEKEVAAYVKNEIAKIVSNNGAEIGEVKTNAEGSFEFTFTPSDNQLYEFIVEREQDVALNDILQSEQDIGIQTQKTSPDLSDVPLKDEINKKEGRVTFYVKDQIVFDQAVSLNAEIMVPKSTLPKGLIEIEIQADRLYKRLIWNDELRKEGVVESNTVHPLSSMIDWSFDVPGSGSYSVAIQRVNRFELSTGFELSNEINSRIDLPQQIGFYKNVSPGRLDLLMMAAKSIYNRRKYTSVPYLPEYRFGLIHGTVKDDTDVPQPDLQVVLTLQGENQYVSAAITDDSGDFILRYDPNLVYQDGSISVVNAEEESVYQIDVFSEFREEYPAFSNPTLSFDSLLVLRTIQRSINNQLENAFQVREQETGSELDYAKLPGAKSYLLSDYTKFPSIRDVFIEFVPEINVSKNEKKFDLKMNTLHVTYQNRDASKTLILIDGKFATGEDVLILPPLYVERVDVLNEKYFYGNVVFNGIISVHTSTHDGLQSAPRGLDVLPVPIQRPSLDIDPMAAGDQVPNRKDLLYWNPAIQTTTGSIDISFHSSDLPGTYKVNIDGFDLNGNLYSQQVYFEIR